MSSSSGRSESDGDAESIGDFNRLESSDSNSVDRMKSCSRLNVPIAPATARGTADSKANSLALAAGATVIVAPAGHSFTLSQNGDQTTTINCTTGTNGSVRSVVFLPSTQTTLSLGQTAGTTNNQSDPTGGQQPQLSVVDENSLLDEMAKNKEGQKNICCRSV